MARALPIAWLNGTWLPLAEARVSPLDRAFLFADAVYEVVAVYGGRPLLVDEHLARLARSLRELGIADPHDDAAWRALIAGLVERNRSAAPDGHLGVYLQVSRGADTGRDHGFPADVPATVFGMASPLAAFDPTGSGLRAITAPDNRWARCDIKSTALLGNVLLRQAAAAAGAQECIMLRAGRLTEGSSSTVAIVEGRTVVTRPDGPEVLPGTTIRLVRSLAPACGLDWREEDIAESRLRRADEIWITSAMRGVLPVTHLDGKPVGAGVPGPAWRTIAVAYERCTRS